MDKELEFLALGFALENVKTFKKKIDKQIKGDKLET